MEYYNEQQIAQTYHSALTIPETIENFLKAIKQAQDDYTWCVEMEQLLNNLTQDYLHQLELVDMNYHQKARVAEALQRCRKNRRMVKNAISNLESLVDFLRSDRGKMAIGSLQQELGKARKATKNIDQRTYSPRVMETAAFRE